MASVDMFVEELRSINREFPGFGVETKDGSWWCWSIFAVLWILTLGKTRFMTDYAILLRKTLYTPAKWTEWTWLDRWILLRHEGVHLRQAKTLGFGWFGLGWVFWALAYLFVLPFGLTLRSRWEREAYGETIRCTQRFGGAVSRSKMYADFTGPAYLWMDLRQDVVSRWLDRMGVVD